MKFKKNIINNTIAILWIKSSKRNNLKFMRSNENIIYFTYSTIIVL